ncbi:MAG: signal recognition particle protein, partial [Clostridia bacterium]|nr:signal recognition particle protein [Clostridia bacterium]
LGMGDVLSLIEKAQETFDEKSAEELEKRLKNQQFTLEDYLMQLKQLKKMGSITDMLKMIPGVGSKLQNVEIDEEKVMKEQKKNEAIILSMTRAERRHPDILNASRRRRIAAGSGTTVQEVNLLIKQYEQAKQMMKQMMGAKGKMRLPFKGMR